MLKGAAHEDDAPRVTLSRVTAPPRPDGTGETPAGPQPESGVVALHGVQKSFRSVPAVVDLHLEVPAGRITVLLGPNGAGKTTAIRLITGAFSPERGTVRTFGLDPDRDGHRVRSRCGVVSAKPALYDRLSGRDNLRYSAELHGLGRGRKVDARIAEVSERFGIAAALGERVGGFSTGMKTRLALARSVLHQPALLLYDEPTSGLDPEASRAVLDLIRESTADGTTVVMCTHLLLEAEGLADQVVVLQDGHAVASGRPEELVRSIWPDQVVRVGLAGRTGAQALEGAAGVLKWRLRESASDRPAGPLEVEVHLEDMDLVPDVVARLTAGGARITRVEPVEPSLEDLYFAVRGATGSSRLGAVAGSAA
jgi:ABC-2 type transport system ATP-binding protein